MRISDWSSDVYSSDLSTIFKGLDAPGLLEKIGAEAMRELREELELVQGAAPSFDIDEYLAGRQTPVFFGSAVYNFGVQLLLDFFIKHATRPRPRATHPSEIEQAEEKQDRDREVKGTRGTVRGE